MSQAFVKLMYSVSPENNVNSRRGPVQNSKVERASTVYTLKHLKSVLI